MPKSVIIGLRVDPELKEEAKKEAERRGLTLTDFLGIAIGAGWLTALEEPCVDVEQISNSEDV